ncbi:38084_t:CDS:2 [Gigaspora margarita]|uniref:38084_t:CDS:1 n=1 Tax=Gigaspora margarita TaxID=4874 RepID=A0ABN7UMV2_GIGMA|nr:38084_t:CDS:2 [Gigaspora margarita]
MDTDNNTSVNWSDDVVLDFISKLIKEATEDISNISLIKPLVLKECQCAQTNTTQRSSPEPITNNQESICKDDNKNLEQVANKQEAINLLNTSINEKKKVVNVMAMELVEEIRAEDITQELRKGNK